MTKVITYGTYDVLHYGHINLLKMAKGLGDYLIVGVTSDDFDKTRGKINNQQTLMQRVAAVKALGIADEVIAEEYEGQKIDDIRKYGIDIFTVGSDWQGKFDYLQEYCKVVYLPRTEGVSSSEIRTENSKLKIGIIGNIDHLIKKFIAESRYVNGIELSGICTTLNGCNSLEFVTDSYDALLDRSDAIYILSDPHKHTEHIRKALDQHKHVLCESPLTLNAMQAKELISYAEEQGCILQEGIKTAFSTAYQRMLLLIKTGAIGQVISLDSTCTSLSTDLQNGWTGFSYWGGTSLLPAFHIFGTKVLAKQGIYHESRNTQFVRMNLVFKTGTASIKAGNGIKSEGDLIISGTEGYIYVPAPWWKTDYFEIRFEDQSKNRRYFYQLDGEGIRLEIIAFLQAINHNKPSMMIDSDISIAISSLMETCTNHSDMLQIE